jgi:hypothetical protein
MKELIVVYDKMLNMITEKSENFREDPISVFNYAKGSNYDNLILFVGRSVNGWKNYKKNELIKNKNNILDHIHSGDLQWTIDCWENKEKDEYNTKKSAFWRMNKKISNKFYGEFDDNFNRISWTNLYKISKADKGNPSERLCNIQFDFANQILKEEVKYLKPKYIFFHTALNWVNPFLKGDLNIQIELLKGKKFVEAKGNYYGSKFIVGQHPQGKPELEQIEEILKEL